MELNDISGQVVDAAFKVHSYLGPGLLENVYQACLKHELNKRGLKALTEVGMPVEYDGICLDLGYRIDLLIELSGRPLGLLINFGQRHLKDGIHRIAN